MDSHQGIVGLDPEALILSQILATKLMLGDEGWSNGDDVNMSSDLTKRVSAWHKNTLQPLLKTVTDAHEVPRFASYALNAHPNPEDGCPITLHIQLLTKASKEILESCAEEISSNTWEKVDQWFGFLFSVRESQLFRQVHNERFENEFNYCLAKYERMSRLHRGEGNGGNEFHFFDPTSIFIKVAHMVYFYTKSNEEDRPPSIRTASITVSAEKMVTWERISGCLFLDIIIPVQRGLRFAESMGVTPTVRFSLMDLPYSHLRQNMTESIRGIPSIKHLQESVSSAMLGAIDDRYLLVPNMTLDQEDYLALGIQRLEKWAHIANDANKKMHKIVQNCEKQRTHYRHSRENYRPVHPRHFQRDIFVTGDESYYYNYVMNAGMPRRSFRRIYSSRRRG